MTISPAGPERDKQIAELRGDTYQHKNCAIGPQDLSDCPDYVGTVEAEPLCPDNCEHNVYYGNPKTYSTDISCAMELDLWPIFAISFRFDGAVIALNLGNDGIIEYVAPISWKVGKRTRTQGEIMADAISGAWLKWRQA
jgi:hypothetical protein